MRFFYSKLSVPIKSSGRIYYEKTSSLRSPYQRDRDRIIHSTAFRRLKHKTQVFVNTNDDHFRTRITHSLEVAQIARTLAKYFNLNEDLCETLSLAHDLGHTPFGHAGENTLNECMIKHGGFDHNIQTIRIVTFIEKKYYQFNGLNLSLETLDGLLKHNGPILNLSKINKILDENTFKKKIDFNRKPSLEAQLASISDDIAYNSHDLEDGLKAKLFELSDLRNVPILSEIVKKHTKRLIYKSNHELVIRQITREIINKMVLDVIENTKKNIKQLKIKSIRDVYNARTKLGAFSEKMSIFDREIKRFLKVKMYFSPIILKRTNYGKKIIKYIFNDIIKKPSNYSYLKKSFKKENRYRIACDFIAGMADRYAINLYKKIK